jgi:hypothetical protein
MIIKVDEEGKRVLVEFADIVFKSKGLQANQIVNQVLNAISLLPVDETTKEDSKEPLVEKAKPLKKVK